MRFNFHSKVHSKGKPSAAAKDASAGGGHLFRRLFRYVRPYKWGFVAALCGMLLVSGGNASIALLLKPIIDQGFVGRDANFIQWVPVFLILLGFARATGSFLDVYCMRWVAAHVVQDLRQLMFARLLRAPAAYYDKNSTGGMASRVLFHVEQVAALSSTAFRTAVRDFFTMLFLLGGMIYLSWKLSLLFAVILPPAFLIFKFSGGRMRRMSERVQDSVGGIVTRANEAMQGHRAVKIFNAYAQEQDAFYHAANKYRQLGMKRVAISAAATPLMVFLTGVGTAIVVWVALHQDISPGTFAAYVTAMAMLAKPIRSLSAVNMTIQTGLAGAKSVFETLDMPGEPDRGEIELRNVKGAVRFDKVSFKYPGHEKWVLKNADIDIPAGATVALVGVSGSGKSTIVSLLLRFYSPDTGQITVDGHPLAAVKLQSLRAHTAIVPQEIILFDDTIANNIGYGARGGLSASRLQDAAAAANVLEFAEQMPDGLDTMIGEQGIRLSGGQRQRIAIARALYKNAPLLIMDEATSSLDSHAERHIQSAIARLVQNRTSLIIAHRLSTIENADMILVLEQGRIVQRGTHAELLRQDGAYARLQKSQRAPK